MEKLIELASSLVSGLVIAVLASWLTNRARNRQAYQAALHLAGILIWTRR
ncbi:hypothetical protein [Streptomyces sp. NPDC092370]